MSENVDTRNLDYQRKLAPMEFKVDHDKRIIEGHASIFGTMDLVGDIIHKGAFKETIKKRFPKNQIKLRWMHWEPIGKVLALSEDSTGLAFEARIAPTTLGDDTLVLIDEEAVDAMSIGFRPKVVEFDEDELDDNGWPIRHIKVIDPLYEISVVDLGAHPDAGISGIKGLHPNSLAELEERFEARLAALEKRFEAAIAVTHAQAAVGGLHDILDMLRS